MTTRNPDRAAFAVTLVLAAVTFLAAAFLIVPWVTS